MAFLRFENECVGCPPEMGCLGSACPKKKVPVFACDECGDELNPMELFVMDDDRMLCEHCLLSNFKTVAEDERGWEDVAGL